MKITSIKACPISVPLGATYWVGDESFSAAALIVVEVATDEGISGLATVHGRSMKTVCEMLSALQDLVSGMDPLAHEVIWAKIFALTITSPDPGQPYVSSALFGKHNRTQLMAALAAIDIAVWDIKGKALRLPIWRLLGGTRTALPAYVTCGYYQSDRDHMALADEMTQYVEQGFTAVKLKVGGIALRDDVARVQAVRDVIGSGRLLMLDANGGYSLREAQEAIRAYECFDLTWFEEPLHWYDTIRALGKLAASTRVAIASGESEVHGWSCRDLVDVGGVRYMQFDATRAAGVTEWLRVASYCQFHGVLMTTHHDPHIQGHLAAAVPNGWNVETFPNPARDPLWAELFSFRAELRDGLLMLNDEPGFGFGINREVVRKYQL